MSLIICFKDITGSKKNVVSLAITALQELFTQIGQGYLKNSQIPPFIIISRFIKEILLAVPNHKNAYIELDNRNKAMDMRGFTSVRRRKRIYEMKFEVVDDIVLVLAIIMLLGTIFTQVYFK